MRDLNVSIIQTALRWHDPPANRAHFDGLIAEIGTSPDLVVLPEMFTTGFTMDTGAHAETMDGESVAWMKLVAQDFQTTLCGSLIIEDGGRYFNRLIWASPNGDCRHYDKRHLFRMAGEHEHFGAGSNRKVFELDGWRVLPLVCYDLRFPVWSRGANEFDLTVVIANWPATRRSAWRALLPARAIENQCYVVGVNRIGEDGNDVRYAGDSAIVDYLGNPVVSCDESETTEAALLSGVKLERYREKFPAYRDADKFTIEP